MYAIETVIRQWSDKYKNGYFVTIFACCRENLSRQIHCDCVAAKTNAEAAKEFKLREDAKKLIVVKPTLEEKLQATIEINARLLEENVKLKNYVGEDDIITD